MRMGMCFDAHLAFVGAASVAAMLPNLLKK